MIQLKTSFIFANLNGFLLPLSEQTLSALTKSLKNRTHINRRNYEECEAKAILYGFFSSCSKPHI